MKNVTITALINDESRIFIIDITVHDPHIQTHEQLRTAITNACKEYIRTPEGKQVFKEECFNDFNWGDLTVHMPDNISKKYGFTINNAYMSDFTVDHDEMLVEGDRL